MTRRTGKLLLELAPLLLVLIGACLCQVRLRLLPTTTLSATHSAPTMPSFPLREQPGGGDGLASTRERVEG
jgi:hypothetical protein